MKNAFVIFFREIKSVFRDAMGMYIVVMPILMAIGITFFTPGLNDTTINLAMLESDDPVHTEYMQDYAKIELFNDIEDIERRIAKRDDVVGLVEVNGEYEVVLQGNEAEVVEQYAKVLQAFYDIGTTKEDTTAVIKDFGHTVPPLKTMLVNMLISMTIMLAGMLIAISIVEEKSENTINAINVTPLSQTGFVVGKSLMGGVIALASIVVSLIITGYSDINWFMIILVGMMSMILTLVMGFVQGLASDDVIEAAANVKMIMLPVAGSIVGYELLADKWQWTMYWSPFYWAYKANLEILSKTASWGSVLISAGMVLAISLVVYLIMRPKIREGLS